jgi:hypothetical protein
MGTRDIGGTHLWIFPVKRHGIFWGCHSEADIESFWLAIHQERRRMETNENNWEAFSLPCPLSCIDWDSIALIGFVWSSLRSIVSPNDLLVGPFFTPQRPLVVDLPTFFEFFDKLIYVAPRSWGSGPRIVVRRQDWNLLDKWGSKGFRCVILCRGTMPQAHHEELWGKTLQPRSDENWGEVDRPRNTW